MAEETNQQKKEWLGCPYIQPNRKISAKEFPYNIWSDLFAKNGRQYLVLQKDDKFITLLYPECIGEFSWEDMRDLFNIVELNNPIRCPEGKFLRLLHKSNIIYKDKKVATE